MVNAVSANALPAAALILLAALGDSLEDLSITALNQLHDAAQDLSDAIDAEWVRRDVDTEEPF